MRARDIYPDDSGVTPRQALGGQCFFLADGTNSVDALTFFIAHYAPLHSVQPVLLVMLPDVFLISVRDPLGRRPQFLRDVNSAFVRYLKNYIDVEGGMIRPGDPKAIVVVDADAEMNLLLEAALAPTTEITPFSRTWCGTVFTPEDAGTWKTVQRPDGVNEKTYPNESITFQIAKPEFQQDDTFETIRSRFRNRRLRAEAKLRKAAKATGKRFIGPNAPQLFDPTFAPGKRLFKTKGPRLRGAPDLVEAARARSRNFHVRYQKCVTDLRAGRTEIEWPAGTNFHHVINGFPRNPATRLTPLVE